MTVHMFMVKLLGTFSSFSSAGLPTPASSLNSEKKNYHPFLVKYPRTNMRVPYIAVIGN